MRFGEWRRCAREWWMLVEELRKGLSRGQAVEGRIQSRKKACLAEVRRE